jgi:hypothetical protein
MPIRFQLPRKLVAFALSLLAVLGHGATYYVASNGLDSGPGDELTPWQTIQKAVDVARAGDTVIVQAGIFNERITTKRGGTSESERITFQTLGSVVMRGWIINHPYITVRGFEITGHSGANNLDGHVTVGGGGDRTIFERNVVRDGIHIVRTNIAFHATDQDLQTITCESGGFLEAGFKPGQTVFIGRGVRVAGPLNSGVRILNTVTDTSMSVSGGLIEEPPSNVYLSGSFIYGLVVANTAEHCLIRSNIFRNLSFDTWLVGGANNTLEQNLLEATHGWDAIHFMGTNNVFRLNVIRNSPLVVYQVSPDLFENLSQARFDNILFERNFVYGFDGVITSQKGLTGDAGPLTYSHNVFIDTGSISIRFPKASFLNNTFIHASAVGNPVAAPLKHPITFEAIHSGNAVLKNNIFVDCGSGRNPNDQGWYEFLGSSATATIARNFVSGPAPSYASKTGFREGIPELNGGDPGFVNINDPLGPDGLAFTDDDGLRLRADSKLIEAGDDWADLGAYNIPPPTPLLRLLPIGPQSFTLEWAKELKRFELQQASNANGPWTQWLGPRTTNETSISVSLQATSPTGFYRLVR